MADVQTNSNRYLPKKESDLFKAVVKFYESKQYKKGIKSADAILKKFPNHGETLAMKGLTLNFMSSKNGSTGGSLSSRTINNEAYDYVRKGLRNDMRSHVCWHVFGLLHRADRNYNEAIKAYKQALRIDPENLQILRDLSLLQIQMRDIQGFVKTRHTILTLKPNSKIHWLAFALSKDLNGDREGAKNVIDIYLSTLSDDSPENRNLQHRGFESSELALYKCTLLEKENKREELLGFLQECKGVVVDIHAWMQLKAKNELMLERFLLAKESYKEMMRCGSMEDYAVHDGYMCALLQIIPKPDLVKNKKNATDTLATMRVLTKDQKETLLKGYIEEIEPMGVRSSAVKRIPLTLLEGENLRKALDTYCRRSLNRGVPSLGSDLSSLFLVETSEKTLVRVKDPVDIKAHAIFKMIEDLVDEYIMSLESNSCFPKRDIEHKEEDEEEPPSTLLWTMYLRAYLFQLAGEYTSALNFLDRCLVHTPTAVDVYELKARVLKLSGDVKTASECLDEGRELDKQDRYINNKTTKYMLQADRVEVARERVALFTRHEGNPDQNLFDMQCAWYELELARCYARTGEWGKSLKKYLAIEKHFEDFHEDQFDFHSYCIRKVTLRAYVHVLKFEDELHSQRYYREAATGIIKNYVYLFDHPNEAIPKKQLEQMNYSNMTPSERKKAKNLARKQKQKQKKKEENSNNGQGKKGGGAGGKQGNDGKENSVSVSFIDDDPNGELLLKKDFLEEAKKYTSILSRSSPQFMETWIMSYDVSIRRKKFPMALQALCKAKSIEAQNADLFTRVVDFSTKLSIEQTNGTLTNISSSEMVQSIVTEETQKTLLENQTILQYLESYLKVILSDAKSDLPMRTSFCEGVKLLCKQQEYQSDVKNVLLELELDQIRKVTKQNCLDAAKCLQGFSFINEEDLNVWKGKVERKLPFITW